MSAGAGADEALRVVLVLEGLALGGVPINAIDLARTLVARGHDVHLLAIEEDALVSILPLAARAGLELALLTRRAGLLTRARQVRRHLRRHDAQVVHVFAPWLARPAVLAAGLRRERVAVVLNWMMHNEYPVTARTPLVVGTPGLRREALGVHGSRVHLLTPPVDLAHDRPDPRAGAEFRAAYAVGPDEVLVTIVTRVDRVMKLSGILLALDAVAHLDAPSLRLAVVGDGNAMAQVREHARAVNERLGREAVLLTGSLADPHPAYAATDVALAMGGSAIRALAHACPLVVLGEHGFSRTLTPDTLEQTLDTGFFGSDEQHDAAEHLAGQLQRLLDPDVRSTLGPWGLEVAERHFGLEAAAATLEDLYRGALADSPGPAVRLLDDVRLTVRDTLGRLRRRVGRR